MQNNLYEFGGNANVYLKALCNFGEYHKGDVVAYLPDVNIELLTNTNDSIIKKDVQNLLSYYTRNITGLKISDLAMSDSLMKILNLKTENNIFVTRMEKHDIDEEGFRIYLQHVPVASEIQIFPSTEYSYNRDSNSIDIAVNQEDMLTEITLYYVSAEQGISYQLEKDNDLPYLQLEIQFLGNIDKATGNAVLFFSKVRIKDSLQFSVEDNMVSNLSLIFDVIHDEDSINKLSMW